MAPGTPCSAANSSSMTACSVLPWRSACVPERNASCGVGGMAERGGSVSGATGAAPGIAPGTAASGVAPPSEGPPAVGLGVVSDSGIVAPSGARVPSKLMAGDRPTAMPSMAPPSKAMLARTLNVRIARSLGRRAGMGHRAIARRSHLLGVLPQISGGEYGRSRLPCLGPRLELGLAELDLERALHRVHGDDVAVAHERDRPADGGFRTHMADAKTAGRSGEAPVGDERDLPAHALSIKGRGGRQHFSHPGAAFGPFVSDHEHVAFPILLLLDGLEARFLPVKAACRAGKLQVRHPSNLGNGAFRREVASEPDDAAGGGERLVGGVDHVLVLVPLHSLEVLGD